jgi:hypothetical protein
MRTPGTEDGKNGHWLPTFTLDIFGALILKLMSTIIYPMGDKQT